MDPRLRAYAVRQVAFFSLSVAVMFLVAGRLDWLGGWLMVATLLGAQAAQWLIVGRRHPDLLVERARVGAGVDPGDIPLAAGLAYGPLVAMLVAALGVRFDGPPEVVPVIVVTGVLVSALGIATTITAMLANRFFAPVVRIQADRGHEVADGGPYRRVRHPGYVGAIVFYLGMPAMLYSWWAGVVMLLTIAICIVRTAREDAYLQANLEGYAAYAERVRWRLVPHIW
jgi:protein-S-isoprenylcysteine O-methyltransferase Ste14